jgi:DNA ligase-1
MAKVVNMKRPMLAPNKTDYEKITFPKLGSPKLDGFRSFVHDHMPLTRSGEEFPNNFVRKTLAGRILDGLDGELIVGAPNLKETFNNSSGPLRRHEGEPDFKFYLFDDRTSHEAGFSKRLMDVHERVIYAKTHNPELAARLVIVPQLIINDMAELALFEAKCLRDGYEGVMLKDPFGAYKFGRATMNENLLVKVKRFETREAVILSFETQMHNENEAFKDELGRTKRSEVAEGLSETDMVGAAWVTDELFPRPFKISLGTVSHEEKKFMKANPGEFIGNTCRYTYFPHGVVEVPRHGQYDGLRPSFDLGG